MQTCRKGIRRPQERGTKRAGGVALRTRWRGTKEAAGRSLGDSPRPCPSKLSMLGTLGRAHAQTLPLEGN